MEPYGHDDDIIADVRRLARDGYTEKDIQDFVARCAHVCRFITLNIYNRTHLVSGRGMFEDFYHEVMIENSRMIRRALSEPDYLAKIDRWQAFLHMRARNAVRLYWEKNMHPASKTSRAMRGWASVQSYATAHGVSAIEAATKLGVDRKDLYSVSAATLEDISCQPGPTEEIEDAALRVVLSEAGEDFSRTFPDFSEAYEVWVDAILAGGGVNEAFGRVREVCESPAAAIAAVKIHIIKALSEDD